MSSSCSHWWHAPVYVAATAALILAAISSSSSSSANPPPMPPTDPIPPELIVTLHRSGFHLSALLLQISSVHVPLPANLTYFALPDRDLTGLSSFPSALRLLRLHALPVRLDSLALARLSSAAACLPTLLPGAHMRVVVAAASPSGPGPYVSVGGSPVTHPDLFLGGPHAVHGVGSRFHDDPDHQDSCRAAEESSKIPAAEKTVPWDRVVRALRSFGRYEPFALALGAVLDALRGDAPFATVFAPWDAGFGHVAVGGEALGRLVRRHVAVGWYDYADLAAVGPEGMQVGTMEEGKTVRVTASVTAVEVDGVEVMEPEVYSEGNVVVHGIAGELTVY